MQLPRCTIALGTRFCKGSHTHAARAQHRAWCLTSSGLTAKITSSFTAGEQYLRTKVNTKLNAFDLGMFSSIEYLLVIRYCSCGKLLRNSSCKEHPRLAVKPQYLQQTREEKLQKKKRTFCSLHLKSHVCRCLWRKTARPHLQQGEPAGARTQHEGAEPEGTVLRPFCECTQPSDCLNASFFNQKRNPCC